MLNEIQSHSTIFNQSFLPFPLFPNSFHRLLSGKHVIFSLLLKFLTAIFHFAGLHSPEEQEECQPINPRDAQI